MFIVRLINKCLFSYYISVDYSLPLPPLRWDVGFQKQGCQSLF